MIELTDDTETMINWFEIWTASERTFRGKYYLELKKIPDPSMKEDYSFDTIEIKIEIILKELNRIKTHKRYFEHDKRLLLMLREYYYKNLEGVFSEQKQNNEKSQNLGRVLPRNSARSKNKIKG